MPHPTHQSARCRLACLAALLACAAGCASAPPAWPGWRGVGRQAITADVPGMLPEQKRVLWQRPLTGPGLAGVVVANGRVVVSDKDEAATHDIFRCLDALTGAPIWTLRYLAAGDMDSTNAPRATPLVHDGLVYLLGAFGHLHCVRLDTGQVVWKRNLVEDFGAHLPMWGMCSSPLITDGTLIVNPGAKDASIVALNPRTGDVVWKCPGRQAAYASFIVGAFGGVRQIVGYDFETLGGWRVDTGQRLWELRPEVNGDFNVPTPIDVGGKLLVATENNGARLYGFAPGGKIVPKPLAANLDLVPDTSSPVVLDGKLFGAAGALFCLDLDHGLKTLWEGVTDYAYNDYVSLIAGNGRILVTTASGELLLVNASAEKYELVSRLRLFDEGVLSHPALVGDRLYVRSDSAIVCLRLGESQPKAKPKAAAEVK